jgi:hypothetical protein
MLHIIYPRSAKRRLRSAPACLRRGLKVPSIGQKANFRSICSHGGSKLPQSQGAFGAKSKKYAALGETPVLPVGCCYHGCFLN